MCAIAFLLYGTGFDDYILKLMDFLFNCINRSFGYCTVNQKVRTDTIGTYQLGIKQQKK